MDIYEENIKYLKENYPYIKWEDEGICEENQVLVQWNENHQLTVAIEEEGHVWYLGSRYDTEKAAEQWVDGFKDVNYRTLFIVIGLGSGIYVKKLHERYPENNIVLCESDMQLFGEILKAVKLEDILEKEIFLAAGKTANMLYTDLIHGLINYDNMREVRFSCIPNYENANTLQCLAVKKHYVNRMERLILGRNTMILDEGVRSENTLANLFLYPEGYSLGQLKECITDYEPEKRAAIIVSAGPSLDKNVGELRKAKNKAVIIVVDTALKTVLNAGVEPDLAVLIDPAKAPSLFEREELLNIPLCVSINANHAIMKIHHGKKFFATRDMDFMAEIAKAYNKDLYVMHTGGSVANNAFSVAGIMGFKKMILVGQDLAYPNGKVHSADAYEDEDDIVMSSKYFEVDDIYGNKVYTEANMDAYRRWFEEQIVFNPDCHVIDATEGGAKIKGAEILTLHEAIERECANMDKVDFRALIERIEPLFSLSEQKEIKENYIGIEKRLKEIDWLLRKQIDAYVKLKNMDQKGDNNSKQFQRTVKEISRYTRELEDNPLLELVRLYKNKLEYEILDELNDKTEESKSEVLIAAKGGEQICETYQKNIDRLKKEWHRLLEENHYI